MSLGIVIKGSEGVVLAADSRVTLSAGRQLPDGTIHQLDVNFDNAKKLLQFADPHGYVGAVTYGAAVVGDTLRTAHSFIPEFELTLPDKRLTVEEYASKLSAFFLEQWNQATPTGNDAPDMFFIVGGYDPEGAYGKVFLFSLPSSPQLEERNPSETEFGMTWGGQLNIASRLIHGYDPALIPILQQKLNLEDAVIQDVIKELRSNVEFTIPYQILPLQDCVDLAILMIRTTIDAQSLAFGVRGVGGMIEVATITRTDKLRFVQQKKIRGEMLY